MVLVVDDDETLRKVYVQQLKRLGVMCDTAANGEEAVALAERKRYRLILMDLRMPVMDGCTAAKKIREKYSQQEVAIIGVTAEDKKQECVGVGMNGYYQKPFLVEHLREVLQRFLPAGGT